MILYSLEIVLENESFKSSIEIWNMLAPMHNALEGAKMINSSTGKSVNVNNLSSSMKRNKKNRFSYFINETGNMHYTNTGGIKRTCAHLRLKNIVNSIEDAAKWLSLFLIDDRFVQARLYDKNYDQWQNTFNIKSYQNSGKPYNHLPIIPNGASPPLDEIVINITQNPGYTGLKRNYKEMVGNVMWLGDKFWHYSGTSKETVLDSTTFEVQENDGVVKLFAQKEPFTSAENGEAELQYKMRELLYPNSVLNKNIKTLKEVYE